MLENRIVLESDVEHLDRYHRIMMRNQRAYEVCYDLAEVFPSRVTNFLVNATYDQLTRTSFDQVGRGRFLRVVGPIRIPLTSVKQPITV